MCGIIGYTGPRQAQAILLEGLHRLEYRGYDSAGLAVNGPAGLEVLKRAGSVEELERALSQARPLEGLSGIAHTRWATHGRPSDANAHPFTDCTGKIAVAHNGIIENHARLREALKGEGHVFRSETDTEVLVHLVERAYKGGLEDAVARALREVEGTFAVVVTHGDEPGVLVGARRENPLVLGVGEGEMFFASDVPALIRHTRRVVYLEDGEVARITPKGFAVSALADLASRPRAPSTVDWDIEAAEKAGYKHFMLKEIFEQPRAIADSLLGRIGDAEIDALLEGLRPVRRVKILEIARKYAQVKDVYFIGRHVNYPSAVEGAHKLKEISYVHAEAYAAGELKHGANALLGPELPVVAIAVKDAVYPKMLSNIGECTARGSPMLAIGTEGDTELQKVAEDTVLVPEVDPMLSPIPVTVALQLFAYHIADLRGCSVDRPRNLAKTVTVE